MIDKIEYAERRKKVIDMMDEGSVCLLFSGLGRKRSGDASYPFEPNRNFYYLTGIKQENSVLMLVKAAGEDQELLFIDEKEERVEKWLGIKMTSEEAQDISGINNVLVRSSLDGKISVALNDATYYGDINKVYLDLEKELKIGECSSTTQFKSALELQKEGLEIVDIGESILRMRLVKSPAEIEMIKDAIKTTEVGLLNVLKELAVGRFEYNMRNIFEFNVKEDLDATLAFDSIVAGGKNAIILHYPNAKDVLHDGDLVLLDVGAAKDYYCSDISRTYPINGKFSALQKKIYEIVLNCNKQTAAFMKPGLTLKEVNEFAKNFLADECFEAGLISSKEEINRVYYHSVGHHLGLDTHDGPESARSYMLEEGNVVTCEPGLYFKEHGIGVRIEDDVLITRNGSEVLSKNIIKEVKDIERFLISK